MFGKKANKPQNRIDTAIAHYKKLRDQPSAPAVAEKLRAGVAGEALPMIACIGPITAQTARELGLHPQIEAATFTIDGLIEAIVSHEGKA